MGEPGVDGRIILRWIGGRRRRYGGDKRYIQGCGGKKLRERDHLGDPGVNGSIILKLIFREWDVGHGLDCSG